RLTAGAGRWAGALRRLRARPPGTTRLLRRLATAARGQRTRGRRGVARRDRSPHLRVWLHSQPSGGSWRKSHFACQPGVVGVALCALPAPSGLVCRPGAMAGGLSARVLRLGGTGGCHVPARVRLPLMPPTSTAPADSPDRSPTVEQSTSTRPYNALAFNGSNGDSPSKTGTQVQR